jgi:hypothetical protein
LSTIMRSTLVPKGTRVDIPMKCMIVYYLNGRFYGEEVSWKRSGSGTYREVSRIEIPQTQDEIERFARENNYVIEWRGEVPSERRSA